MHALREAGESRGSVLFWHAVGFCACYWGVYAERRGVYERTWHVGSTMQRAHASSPRVHHTAEMNCMGGRWPDACGCARRMVDWVPGMVPGHRRPVAHESDNKKYHTPSPQCPSATGTQDATVSLTVEISGTVPCNSRCRSAWSLSLVTTCGQLVTQPHPQSALSPRQRTNDKECQRTHAHKSSQVGFQT